MVASLLDSLPIFLHFNECCRKPGKTCRPSEVPVSRDWVTNWKKSIQEKHRFIGVAWPDFCMEEITAKHPLFLPSLFIWGFEKTHCGKHSLTVLSVSTSFRLPWPEWDKAVQKKKKNKPWRVGEGQFLITEMIKPLDDVFIESWGPRVCKPPSSPEIFWFWDSAWTILRGRHIT